MILLERSIRKDEFSDFMKIHVSNSFKKQVIKSVSNILKSKCKDYLNLKKTIISFQNFAVHSDKENVMVCKEFCITDPYNFSVDCTIFWRSKTSERLVQLTDEVEDEELEFWIENPNPYDIYELLIKNTKDNMAYRSKFFIEGYPFQLLFEMVGINSYLKIFSEDKIDEDFKNKIEELLNHEVDVFNTYNIDNQVGGVIHSIALSEFKKNKYLKFYIDFGSSGEKGIFRILDILKDSNLKISKVELKGA